MRDHRTQTAWTRTAPVNTERHAAEYDERSTLPRLAADAVRRARLATALHGAAPIRPQESTP